MHRGICLGISVRREMCYPTAGKVLRGDVLNSGFFLRYKLNDGPAFVRQPSGVGEIIDARCIVHVQNMH